MGLMSKQEKVLELFFNEGTKHWHFKEIVRKAKISEDRANYWLKQFVKEKIVKHVKPKGKMPYFIANFDHPNYKNKKKLFALNKLYESGFLSYLQSLEDVKTVVIFGSFSRSDWYTDSDIDVFILGNPKELNTVKYWAKLHKQIEPHIYHNLEEIKKIRSGLMKNVLDGYLVKGNLRELIGVIS